MKGLSGVEAIQGERENARRADLEYSTCLGLSL